jgi:hypothetical protein
MLPVVTGRKDPVFSGNAAAFRFAVKQIREPIRNLYEIVQLAVSKTFHKNFRNSSPLKAKKKANGKTLHQE